jgi:hypothetical protein
LGEESDPEARRPDDEAFIGLKGPCQNFQKCRLTFPVPPHQSDALTLLYLKVRPIQKGTLTILSVEVLTAYQGHGESHSVRKESSPWGPIRPQELDAIGKAGF